MMGPPSDAELIYQFNRSYREDFAPEGVDESDLFHIENNFPTDASACSDDYPWLDINFKTEPKRYIDELLNYCFEGMLECDFIVQNNQKRRWYHAPWMHYSDSGREPLRGLTYERPTPPQELASTQTSWLQTWAIGFYNEPGATTFGQVWSDPPRPAWSANVRFPCGSVVFKLLFTDATVEELPFLEGSPEWQAYTARQLNEDKAPTPGNRNTTPSTVRLLQVDVAARDERAETAWTFGTFVYNGRGISGSAPSAGFRRLIPAGLMWGNDPQLTQVKFQRGEKGGRPVEHWINPAADELLRQLRSDRPFWGWNGRMNGPADNFISACSSCHSVAQTLTSEELKRRNGNVFNILTPPKPQKNLKGEYIPDDDTLTMKWFRNLKDTPFGDPYNPDEEPNPSGDYSLQLMIGYLNFDRFLNRDEPQSAKRYSRLWPLL